MHNLLIFFDRSICSQWPVKNVLFKTKSSARQWRYKSFANIFRVRFICHQSITSLVTIMICAIFSSDIKLFSWQREYVLLWHCQPWKYSNTSCLPRVSFDTFLFSFFENRVTKSPYFHCVFESSWYLCNEHNFLWVITVFRGIKNVEYLFVSRHYWLFHYPKLFLFGSKKHNMFK